MKVVNINGRKMLMDEDGKLHKIADKYYDINEYHSNNFAFKRPQEKKVKKQGTIFTGLDTKRASKSKTVEKIMLNEDTLEYLNNNPDTKEKIFKHFGLFDVDQIINSDVSEYILYIYYDDDRYEVICIGDELYKRKHFAEKLLGDED